MGNNVHYQMLNTAHVTDSHNAITTRGWQTESRLHRRIRRHAENKAFNPGFRPASAKVDACEPVFMYQCIVLARQARP